MPGGAQGSQGAQGGLLGMAGPDMQSGGSSGLLGMFGRGKQKGNSFDQMAAPYAQWAAQQLQQVVPETPVPQPQQFDPNQQQALSQMWDYYQNQNNQPYQPDSGSW